MQPQFLRASEVSYPDGEYWFIVTIADWGFEVLSAYVEKGSPEWRFNRDTGPREVETIACDSEGAPIHWEV